jgi:hypothetical protein
MVPYAFRTPKPGGRNTPTGHARPWPGSATPSKPDSLDRNRRSQAHSAPAILLAPARPRPNRALLPQAYVLAACNLHVLDGFPLPFALPSEEEFRALIGRRTQGRKPTACPRPGFRTSTQLHGHRTGAARHRPRQTESCRLVVQGVAGVASQRSCLSALAAIPADRRFT